MPTPETALAARVLSVPSQSQKLEQIASAATTTGIPSLPIILTGNASVVKTVIDSLNPFPAWDSQPLTSGAGREWFTGDIVRHRSKHWQCIADTDLNPIIDTEPEVGASAGTYWTELDLGGKPGADVGRVAAKVVIQNVGVQPILVAEGGNIPAAASYHPPILAAGSANDDGLGSMAQWDDFRSGCIRITSSSGAWRAAVKIIWRNPPIQ